MADTLKPITGNDSLRKYFDSPYMGAYSIADGAEPIVTISAPMFGKITLDGGRKEDHVVLQFVEKSVPGMSEVKPLVLNATNQKTLEKLYGKGADVLSGKKVQFYIDPAVKAIGGGTTEGIRIRPRVPRQEAATGPIVCADCKNEITQTVTTSGGVASPAQLAALSRKRFGRELCAECMKKLTAPTGAPQEPQETEAADAAD